ncbi:hypothetical protein WJX74_001849 [Apatococcus lobatus]|uniref:folate gamma-glutamyl hydrolase n=1 Tax=Apatococcus lobatus TaxID=904363 RepID=A0AAW1Q5A2_9CHLO
MDPEQSAPSLSLCNPAELSVPLELQTESELRGPCVNYVSALFALALSCQMLQRTHIEARRNDRPLIGIVSEPGGPSPEGYSYIAGSYVRFIESAGARAVPIPYDLPIDETKRRFGLINGVLIPGGAGTLAAGYQFFDTAKLLMELALAANDQGDYFPVHGTCLGFQLMCIAISQNESLLSSFDAGNYPSVQSLTQAAGNSRFYAHFPDQLRSDVMDLPITMQNHHFGVTLESFRDSQKLTSFFDLLSTAKDRQGKEYVNTIEGKKYPFSGCEWHPEKNAYEWAPQLGIPHSPEAIDVTYAAAKFVVGEARKNFHATKDIVEEDGLLVYRYQTLFTGLHKQSTDEHSFEECYLIPEALSGMPSAVDGRQLIGGQY